MVFAPFSPVLKYRSSFCCAGDQISDVLERGEVFLPLLLLRLLRQSLSYLLLTLQSHICSPPPLHPLLSLLREFLFNTDQSSQSIVCFVFPCHWCETIAMCKCKDVGLIYEVMWVLEQGLTAQLCFLKCFTQQNRDDNTILY